jgi:adenine-specific DNA-methyltransferase
MTEVQEKFIKLLKEMFQFDQADLDFGIYKIMNAKHDEIEKFLNEDLPNDINEGLKALNNPVSAEKVKELEDKIKLAIEMDMPKDKIDQLVAQKNSLTMSSDSSAAENEIYNNLLDFFSRYYDEGDFISQRRYSKGKYAIPYEGEEVKLHWANADQYYIKTSEYFKDYTFGDGFGNKVHFKILDAETEQNNNKSKNKKFFQLTSQEKKFELIDDEFYIYVEYKAGTQKTQKPYNTEIIDAFVKFTNADLSKYQKFSGIAVKERGQETSLLEKHLTQYTAKNSFDYFIHKNLRGFLNQELDFYIKNEIIRLDDIDETDEAKTKLILTKAKVLRTIAKKIIAFLAQLEDFQKKLFLKKKFVTETNYCITLDRIDESFYKEIVTNDEQRKEWVKLFAIDEIKNNPGELESKTAYSEPLTEQFLKENPYLVLDTAFFSAEFKEKLVASIDDFDEKLDGLLIHSENFQALNLLQRKYQDSIKTIYIDPPYNTGSDNSFAYKDNYQHSSWATMMNDRAELSWNLMNDKGCIFVSTDDGEYANLKLTFEGIFGPDNFVSDIIWNSRKSVSNDAFISGATNHTTFFAKNYSVLSQNKEEFRISGAVSGFDNPDNDPKGPWKLDPFDAPGIRENETYIIKNPNTGVEYLPPAGRCWRYPPEEFKRYLKEGRILFGKTGNSKPGFKRYLSEAENKGLTVTTLWNIEDVLEDNENDLEIKKGTQAWTDCKTTTEGTQLLLDMFGDSLPKTFIDTIKPKPVEFVQKAIDVSSGKKSHILDYFAGSGTTGHATINLNRRDKTTRKYILCEMGEYFDILLKPRVIKAIYSKTWKDGKPIGREGLSQAFKYIRLESYEDTLNNIKFEPAGNDLLDDARKDYVLNYMLDFESKNSDSLLNLEKLSHPFNYTMKITRKQECKEQKIDLIETFNYLIGLKVTSNGALQSYDATFSTDSSKPLTATLKNNGSIYRIKMVEGINRYGERVLIIWRDLTGDIEKDNAVLDAFFSKMHVNPLDFEYKTIYVNGDNNLQNVKTEDEVWKVVLIESEMKKRMFSER